MTTTIVKVFFRSRTTPLFTLIASYCDGSRNKNWLCAKAVTLIPAVTCHLLTNQLRSTSDDGDGLNGSLSVPIKLLDKYSRALFVASDLILTMLSTTVVAFITSFPVPTILVCLQLQCTAFLEQYDGEWCDVYPENSESSPLCPSTLCCTHLLVLSPMIFYPPTMPQSLQNGRNCWTSDKPYKCRLGSFSPISGIDLLYPTMPVATSHRPI